MYIDIPRQDSVISLSNNYLDSNFGVIHAATYNRYADGNDIGLVILGPIALFSNSMLTTSSRKHLKEFSLAHIVSLMYKSLTSSKRSYDMSIVFDPYGKRRQRDLTNTKNQKRNYRVRIYFKNFFGFVEHQGKATFGLGHQLTLT